MKVERQNPTFTPIDITIETKGEARALFHLLNWNPSENYSIYKGCGDYKTSLEEVNDFKRRLLDWYSSLVEEVEK